LIVENNEITDLSQIIKEQANFYKSLYSTNKNTSHRHEIKIWIYLPWGYMLLHPAFAIWINGQLHQRYLMSEQDKCIHHSKIFY
jgi:hypothetical protein